MFRVYKLLMGFMVILITLGGLSALFSFSEEAFHDNSALSLSSDDTTKLFQPHPSLNSLASDFSKNRNLNLIFRENKGQVPKDILYYANFPEWMLGFGSSKIYFSLGRQTFQLEFLGTNSVSPQARGKQPGYSNYFIGDISLTNIGHFTSIIYPNLYEGINLTYQITSIGIKYQFCVEPYADISQIKMQYSGIDTIEINSDRVILSIADRTFVDDSLIVYYAETNQTIDCSFRQLLSFNKKLGVKEKIIQFDTSPAYNSSRKIIIDPLIYSTFIGGADCDERPNNMALDNESNIYFVGRTNSSNFPAVDGYDSTYNGGQEAFLCKLSADGSTLLYSTFIGGSGDDYGANVALDSHYNIYIIGYTGSQNFPVVNAYDSTYNGGKWDVFACKLSANGTKLLYSTYIGGNYNELPYNSLLSDSDILYIAGYTDSTTFPMVNAYDDSYNGVEGSVDPETGDVFVCELSTDGTSLLYSTYIGGKRKEHPGDIALDHAKNIYITGYTKSDQFPAVNAYDSTHNGNMDAFVCKLSADGSRLLYSTVIGDYNNELGAVIEPDSEGNVIVCGWTASEGFPVVKALDSTHNGNMDAFICKMSADGSKLLYSSFIGGYNDECVLDVSLDSSNNIYFTGYTKSTDFPTNHAFDESHNGNKDAYVCRLSADGTTLCDSSYIGGINDEEGREIIVDETGICYLIGHTASADFPVLNAYDLTYNGGGFDLFLCQFSFPQDSDGDGLSDSEETTLGTDPFDSDTDGDGMPDGWEVNKELDPQYSGDASSDPDNDGLTNLQEYQAATHPQDSDTDNDGMPDGWEVNNELNPHLFVDNATDLDNDGLINIEEFRIGTDPQNSDSDNDGMPDGWEVSNGLNPTQSSGIDDPDNDGLTNLREMGFGTDPLNSDTDNDGLPDGWEVTNQFNASNPLDASQDEDGDWVSNLNEYQGGSDPRNMWNVPLLSLSLIHVMAGGILTGGIISALGLQTYRKRELKKYHALDFRTIGLLKSRGFPDYTTFQQAQQVGAQTIDQLALVHRYQTLNYATAYQKHLDRIVARLWQTEATKAIWEFPILSKHLELPLNEVTPLLHQLIDSQRIEGEINDIEQTIQIIYPSKEEVQKLKEYLARLNEGVPASLAQLAQQTNNREITCKRILKQLEAEGQLMGNYIEADELFIKPITNLERIQQELRVGIADSASAEPGVQYGLILSLFDQKLGPLCVYHSPNILDAEIEPISLQTMVFGGAFYSSSSSSSAKREAIFSIEDINKTAFFYLFEFIPKEAQVFRGKKIMGAFSILTALDSQLGLYKDASYFSKALGQLVDRLVPHLQACCSSPDLTTGNFTDVQSLLATYTFSLDLGNFE